MPPDWSITPTRARRRQGRARGRGRAHGQRLSPGVAGPRHTRSRSSYQHRWAEDGGDVPTGCVPGQAVAREDWAEGPPKVDEGDGGGRTGSHGHAWECMPCPTAVPDSGARVPCPTPIPDSRGRVGRCLESGHTDVVNIQAAGSARDAVIASSRRSRRADPSARQRSVASWRSRRQRCAATSMPLRPMEPSSSGSRPSARPLRADVVGRLGSGLPHRRAGTRCPTTTTTSRSMSCAISNT